MTSGGARGAVADVEARPAEELAGGREAPRRGAAGCGQLRRVGREALVAVLPEGPTTIPYLSR